MGILLLNAFFEAVLFILNEENSNVKGSVSRQLKVLDLKRKIYSRINNRNVIVELKWRDLVVHFSQGASNNKIEFVINSICTNFKEIKS